MRTTRDLARLLPLLLLAGLCAACSSPREKWALAAGTFTLSVETVNDAYDAGLLDEGDLDAAAPAVERGYAALDEARTFLPPEGGQLEDRGRFLEALGTARAAASILDAFLEGGAR